MNDTSYTGEYTTKINGKLYKYRIEENKMNNKVIIDGVDVSECEFLKKCIIEGCKIDNSLCCNMGNCYYKQLKRLEQENKLLEEEKRDKIKLLEQVINILYPDASDKELYDVAFNVEFINKLKEIKAENEELKEEYKQFQHISADEVHRLRKALVEIREDMQEDTTCESRECGCDDYAQCLNCIKETIITKINEVLK